MREITARDIWECLEEREKRSKLNMASRLDMTRAAYRRGENHREYKIEKV